MSKFNLEDLVIRTLIAAEKQLHSSCNEYINDRINKARSIENNIKYFRCFKELIWEKIKLILNGELGENQNEFLMEFGDISYKAKERYLEREYPKNIHEFKDFYNEFAYDDIYCNAYLRYSFSTLFNQSNKIILEELKKYDIDEVISSFDGAIHLFTFAKLRYSFGKDYNEEFSDEKEDNINMVVSMIKEVQEKNMNNKLHSILEKLKDNYYENYDGYTNYFQDKGSK